MGSVRDLRPARVATRLFPQGSAEMPSAGRAFTWRLLFNLQRGGIETAYIVLHTGLSSYMDDELDAQHPASEEEYFVSERAAEKINDAHARGGRVIAVGTTVVRTLESAADEKKAGSPAGQPGRGAGQVRAGHGYTRLRITADHVLRRARSVPSWTAHRPICEPIRVGLA